MKIAVLPGDGIGAEIIVQALSVLKRIDLPLETEQAPVGGAGYDASGDPLPEATLKLAKEADAILFGAVGGWQYDQLPRAKRPEQAIHFGLRQRHRQKAVLEAVVVEDVAERRRDHAAKAEVLQRPRRMLARAATAEILACNEDLGALVAGLVEDELLVEEALRVVHPRLAVVAIAPRIEQVRPVACALDRLEELLGDDRVGVDVRPVHRGDQACQYGKFFHGVSATA